MARRSLLAASIPDLSEFRGALQAGGDAELSRALEPTWRRVSALLRDTGRGATSARRAKAIQATPVAKGAGIRVIQAAGAEDAGARFFGAKRRTGWFAAQRYDASGGAQFPTWVGNRWTPGDGAGVPYEIGRPINAAVPQVLDLLSEGIAEALSPAFPD